MIDFSDAITCMREDGIYDDRLLDVLRLVEACHEVPHRATPEECRRRLRELLTAIEAPENMMGVIGE